MTAGAIVSAQTVGQVVEVAFATIALPRPVVAVGLGVLQIASQPTFYAPSIACQLLKKVGTARQLRVIRDDGYHARASFAVVFGVDEL